MKKIIYIITFIFLSSMSLAADQIYLRDSKIINCKILQVTNTRVEYDPEGDIPFLAVNRDNVEKIVYDNGTAVKINEEAGVEIQTEAGEPKPVAEEEIITHTGGFTDSIIRAAFIAGTGDTYDRILTKERDAVRANEPEYHTDYRKIRIYNNYYGLDADLMLPSIEFTQRRGFDLTGLKFGLKAMYLKYIVDSTLYYYNCCDDDIRESYSGRLLSYRTANAGPEMNLIFSPRNDNYNMVIQFYLTGGYIHKGKLSAVPALRDAGYPFDRSEYHAEFSGYSIIWGTGLHFVFNRVIPFTLGFNFQLGYSKIDFESEVPVYQNSKSTYFNDNGFNFTAGVHL